MRNLKYDLELDMDAQVPFAQHRVELTVTEPLQSFASILQAADTALCPLPLVLPAPLVSVAGHRHRRRNLDQTNSLHFIYKIRNVTLGL